MIVDHALGDGETLLETAPALHVYLPIGVELLVKSITVPALGLERHVPGLESRALDPRTIHGHVDESALAMTRHAPLLPVCGLIALGRGHLTATGKDGCSRDRLAVARPGVTARGHTGPATGHVTVAGLVTARGLGRGVGGLDGVAGTA